MSIYGLYPEITWDDVSKYLKPINEYKILLYKSKQRLATKFGKVFQKAYDDMGIREFDGTYGIS